MGENVHEYESLYDSDEESDDNSDDEFGDNLSSSDSSGSDDFIEIPLNNLSHVKAKRGKSWLKMITWKQNFEKESDFKTILFFLLW